MHRFLGATRTGDDESIIEYGPLRIDLDGFAVAIGGRDVRVTYSEFYLLKTLVLSPYRVFDRAALIEAIRPTAPDGDALASDVRLIDRHVARLRKKLRDAGCDCIETMRFAGYRFVPPVDDARAPALARPRRSSLAG